jgi:hypothetical protein
MWWGQAMVCALNRFFLFPIRYIFLRNMISAAILPNAMALFAHKNCTVEISMSSFSLCNAESACCAPATNILAQINAATAAAACYNLHRQPPSAEKAVVHGFCSSLQHFLPAALSRRRQRKRVASGCAISSLSTI